MIAGTLPERFKDSRKKRPADGSFKAFRKDYLMNELNYCEFLANYNLCNTKRLMGKKISAPKKEEKKSNPKLAFFKIRYNKTKV